MTRTVISLEQALSLPYATWRFAHLGWRVIRIEATPGKFGLPGDPNRYIGKRVAGNDRRSYYLAPNVGKEAISINLKIEEGRAALHRIIKKLDVDVFCCNTLPGRYEDLGIDYDTLKEIKPDIIWAGISAMGPEYPFVPGYDPAIQAMAGYMEVTGYPDGLPTMTGIPLIDLKAGDEVYAGVWQGLAEKAETGKGKRLDVSMLQAASSWLITTLPLVNFDPDPLEISRAGNQHRKFIPTDVFQTRDSYLYIAVGNDVQWKRLVGLEKFECCSTPARFTNEGRHAEREAMFADLKKVTRKYTSEELTRDLHEAKIPCSPVNDIPGVLEVEALKEKFTSTTMPDGRKIVMTPLPVDLPDNKDNLTFPARYGEHTEAVLSEVGYDNSEIADMLERGIVAAIQKDEDLES